MPGLDPGIHAGLIVLRVRMDCRVKPGNDRGESAAFAGTDMVRLSLHSLTAPLTRYGIAVAVVAALIDQASKLWLLFVYDLPARGRVAITPFLDFVFTRNTGISYGWFQGSSALWQWALLGIKAAAVVLLLIWLARSTTRLTALSLGLIIGGAIGNAIDRLAYGFVVDFVLFHINTALWRFYWYVFNLADVAIVAGVAGLLYESVFSGRAVKAP
jgi:signal peptidase II